MEKEEALKNFPVQVRNRVDWGDMDAYAHLNNVVFFRYFENARIDFFKALGGYRSGTPNGIGPILAATSCRYKMPVTFPDHCISAARVTEIREHDFLMEYVIYSEAQKQIVAIGDGRVVAYDYSNGHKVLVPEGWRGAIANL